VKGEHPLTSYIINNNLSNGILARRVGITPNYLSMIRHGTRLPSPELMDRICRMLKREPGELFPDYRERRRATLARHRRKK